MKNLYFIPRVEEIKKYQELSETYHAGFEYNDFYNPKILEEEEAVRRIIRAYCETGRDFSQDTMHGVFYDICINSSDPRIYAASDFRVRQSMDIAKAMGLKAVVFHTNYIVNFRLQSYLNSWVNRNEEYWRGILKEYPEQSIYMENMFDDSPMMLKALADRMKDEERFHVCLDIAHGLISGASLENWFEVFGDQVSHVHINDNDGKEDLHAPVGTGKVDWKCFDRWAKGLKNAPSVLIEVRGISALEKSLSYMEKEKIYPFG